MSRVLRRTALVTAFVLSTADVAHAQSPDAAHPDPLAAARALFADALHDEDAGRFGDALDKFMRVRVVRDTPSIEYRLGTCYEGLGEPVPAFRAYLAAQALGSGDSQSADVLRAASERLDALAKQVARLTLVAPTPTPPDLEVRVDDGLVAPGVGPIPLAPGHHVVRATADGAAPFTRDTMLAPGEQASVTVTLDPLPATAEPPASPSSRASTPGWLAIGGGVVLATASAILLVARHDAIAELNHACPGGLCPPGADANSLESTRSRALVEGPVGIACGVAAVALAALGVYEVASVPPSAKVGLRMAIAPTLTREGAGLALVGAYR
jgi:hypothetical protein